MAKIHGLVYILIGLFVVIASWKIDYNDMILFFYVGWIFVLVGIVKLFLMFGKKEETKSVHHAQHNRSSGHIQHSKNKQHQNQLQNYKRCPRCHNVLRIHDRFCNRCGYGA